LAGIKILEVSSIGPGPFAAMMLADMGANVLRIERAIRDGRPFNPVLDRGRSGVLELDLKSSEGRAEVMQLVRQADALIEGFRPGVMERLGLGPNDCFEHNAKLVYGRITGWGRHGALAHTAGHDINYVALTGALHALGTEQSGPMPPLNLVGDFGGGGMLLALGIVSALLESRTSGRGQVVDAAMIDGTASLMAMIYGLRAIGQWNAPRAGNILDGSAYYYRCYLCADDRWIAVGAIEPTFRALFLEGIGLDAEMDTMTQARDDDPAVHARIEAIIRQHDRSHWQRVFEGTDACVTPVLSMEEAPMHPHNVAWGTFSRVNGIVHPRPAPRFGQRGLGKLQPHEAQPDARLREWTSQAVARQLEIGGTIDANNARDLGRVDRGND
jgi:alpha-methylacyl-CoA racemase